MAGSVKEYFRREPLAWLVLLFVVVGVVGLLVGLMYGLLSAGSLPSFVPGHVAGLHRKRTQRAYIGLVWGVMALIIGGVIATDLGKHRKPSA